MTDKDVFKKNRNFYIGIAGTVVEGLLSGSLFLLLYTVMRLLWSGTFDLSRALKVTGLIAVIFFFRIVIYSFGYTGHRSVGRRSAGRSACFSETR